MRDGGDIAVTGCGAISPLGVGVEALYAGLREGRNGISASRGADAGLASSLLCGGGYVQGFDAEAYDGSSGFGRIGRGAQYAIVAADAALAQAGPRLGGIRSDDVGLVLTTVRTALEKTLTFYETLVTQGPRATAPLVFQETVNNAAASHITLRHNLTGPCVTLASGGTSFLQGVALAAGWLRRGLVRIALVVGAEGLPEVCRIAHRDSRGHAPIRPGGAHECCPFDRRRNGYVLAEGAAALVLETRAHADARGMECLAGLAGWGSAHDGCGVGRVHPLGLGLEKAMVEALESAGYAAEAIDWIVAAANSSPVGDAAEARALQRVWGPSRSGPRVSAIASMLGEMEGAAGGFGILAALLGIRGRALFPTINYREPDPECQVNCVANSAIDASPERVLVNALGFGGSASALVVEKM